MDNVRVPSYSEMKILAKVNGCTTNKSSLEGNLKYSDLMVARALVIPCESAPVHSLNPTGKPIVLYSRTNVAMHV